MQLKDIVEQVYLYHAISVRSLICYAVCPLSSLIVLENWTVALELNKTFLSNRVRVLAGWRWENGATWTKPDGLFWGSCLSALTTRWPESSSKWNLTWDLRSLLSSSRKERRRSVTWRGTRVHILSLLEIRPPGSQRLPQVDFRIGCGIAAASLRCSPRVSSILRRLSGKCRNYTGQLNQSPIFPQSIITRCSIVGGTKATVDQWQKKLEKIIYETQSNSTKTATIWCNLPFARCLNVERRENTALVFNRTRSISNRTSIAFVIISSVFYSSMKISLLLRVNVCLFLHLPFQRYLLTHQRSRPDCTHPARAFTKIYTTLNTLTPSPGETLLLPNKKSVH